MRKILIIAIIILLLVLSYNVLTNGIKIGNFEIASINNIKETNEKLDKDLEEASKLTSLTFSEKQATLNSAYKEFNKSKLEYEEKVNYSTQDQVQQANQLEKFSLEILYAKVGTYATKHGLHLKFDIVSSSSGNNDTFDLKIWADGSYNEISDFVRELENDNLLEFRIEDFKIVTGYITPPESGNGNNTDNLIASFVVRNVMVDIDKNMINTTTQSANNNQQSNDKKNEDSKDSAKEKTVTNTAE